MKLEPEFIEAIGANTLPENIKDEVLVGIQEVVMKRTFDRVMNMLTDKKIEEFNQINQENTGLLLEWLDKNVSNLSDVIADVKSEIIKEVNTSKEKALASANISTR